MKHNGVEYTATPYGDVMRYDGGTMGGQFSRYPSGMIFDREIGWHRKFEDAADAMQAVQRKKYEQYREFVMQYEKEALK